MSVTAAPRTNLNDRVYETLKTRLVRRELGPGEKVSLHELAGSLGVSLRVSRFRPSGRGADNWNDLRPSPTQLLAFSAWLGSTASVRTA